MFIGTSQEGHLCNSNPETIKTDSYLKKTYISRDLCKDKNKNNDCKDYKPKLAIKIKNFFQR
jgi:hypothetical protein